MRYVGQAKYLNGMKAVATYSIDDTTATVATALDVIDRCGIKATIFVQHGPGSDRQTLAATSPSDSGRARDWRAWPDASVRLAAERKILLGIL